ncbi:diguanylate cyclase [Paenibacillus sp. MMS20-IR301]|uniref:diguanylate cyclase n=1 Tax=Paenibacillus sp. MMS20-IR301 TaxID=2895946 RepID=UPI0028EC72C0|nr:diguanylate cyclase [Paenibacillus sp. MMS20-IR301]WNS44620.1 diguanylate cyclase [Paenibacillus sp. MMS20-IR301]
MIANGNYQILETISDHNIKAVYRCSEASTGETVILKVLKAEFTGTEAVMRFKQEYKLLSELSRHTTGVIRPLKLEEVNGLYIMVLEDISGRSLKQILVQEKPEQKELLQLAVKVVDILASIHEQNVIHKDIKPSNIIWNREQDIVQVIDFDLAVKLSKERREFQNSGVLEGSLLYISPEQTGRMNRNIDYRSDYYSLGVVLYEMMTGLRPFDAPEMLEQIYSIIAKEAVPPYMATGGKVSSGLSAVIMKLMEKSSEDRYRSAYGIKADLKKCLAETEEFVIGAEDRRDTFRIPQKIVGRQQELTRLVGAFRSSVKASSQLMLISGDAGVGKTALVHELHQTISREKGLFAEGKFDQYNKNIPYSALIQAFRRLISQLLESPDEDYKSYISRSLNQALDGNGRVIAGLIPELSALIQVQPDPEPLGPSEETNRFFMSFAKFVEGIIRNDKPLVLFLDDLQWADYSSLQLVEKLMLDNHLQRLFVILSYRQNEIHEGHPLFASIAKIEKNREVSRIHLSPLKEEDVQSLIADALYSTTDRVQELSGLVYKRSKGNSFFLTEILKDLHKRGLFYFDKLSGEWNWRLAQIASLPVNDNVVDFLVGQLQTLPEEVRSILMLSSAIGSEFDYSMLTLIADAPPEAIAAAVGRAVQEEFILPSDHRYAIFAGALGEPGGLPVQTGIRLKFAHDRIQQAFYQLLDAERGKKLHLSIGRLLLKNLDRGEVEEKLVDIAAHMNKGLEYISDSNERDEVIALNLRAAQKAKAGFGYDSAFLLLEAAITLLPPDSWSSDRGRTPEIYRVYAECSYLTHHVEQAEQACSLLLAHTTDPLGLAEIYEMQANHYMYLGMMPESIASGRRGLQVLGIHIPAKAGMVSVLKELLVIKAALRGRSPEGIFASPEMKDPQMKLVMRLLINFIPPSFISGETSLFGLVVLKKVGLTLKYGNSPESALAFIGYAMLLSGFGDTKGAFEFGRLGIRINDKFNDLQWKGAANVLYTLFCHSWTEPWDTLQEWFGTSIEASLKTGDLLYLAHSAFYVNLWNPSMDIAATLQESARTISMIENTKYKESLATAQLARQYFLSLAGELAERTSFNSEQFSEEVYLRELGEAKYYSGIAIYYIYKMKLLFTYEQHHEALKYIDKAYPIIGTLAGSAFMEEFALYTFLNLAYAYKDLSLNGKRKAKSRMRKEFGRVRKWAKHAPGTFLQHEYLMRAEWARIAGADDKAGHYYDLAIETSEQGSFVRYKALSNELAARFYYHKEFNEFAAYLLRQSAYYYSVWGAKEKIKFLNEQYPSIIRKINTKEFLHGRTVTDFTESIDLNSMIMASQAISKEIELNNLLEALMEIVIKNAGAQRGCILMISSANLLVEGEYKADTDRISVAMHEASRLEHLPLSIIKQVEESRESLIYNDAYSETPFVNDPYIVRHQPKSMVCMPLINQNKTIAIIYLENNLVTGVFTKERMKIINLLSREMVFSLENASLYSELERSEEKYRELVNNLQDGIFITQDNRCKYVNEALAQMLGYEMDEMLDQPFENFISPSDRDKVMHYYARRVEGKQAPYEYETRLVHKDKTRELIVIHKVIRIMYMDRPAIQGTVKDITERKKAEEELRRHKEHLEELVVERTKELEFNNKELNKYIGLIEQISITDELTGLYNRRYFNKLFLEEVEKAAAVKQHLTYLMLDIDYFKKYNDTYGHYEGDTVLRRVGQLLKELAEWAGGVAFRLGGEEFGIMVTGFTPQQSRDYAEMIRRSIAELRIQHDLSPEYGRITVSIGVAAVLVDGLREEDIYKLGDDALYQSKAEGRNCVTLFEQ